MVEDLALADGGADARSRRHAMAEHGGSLEFQFS
jgi:hypothetical protein